MKEVFKRIIIAVALLAVGFVAYNVVSLVSETNGYLDFSPHKGRFDYLLNEEALNDLQIKSSFKNESGDVVSMVEFGESIKGLIWEFHSLSKVPVSKVKLRNSSGRIDQMESYFSITLREEVPIISLDAKMNIPDPRELYFKIDYTQIEQKESGEDFIAMNLDFSQVSLGVHEGSNEIVISPNQWINSGNILLLNRDSKFVLVLMYPTDSKAKISIDMISENIKGFTPE